MLLVDDQIFDASAEVVALHLAGYDVTTVQTGEASLLLLARSTFDCILLDLALPGMSGIEVLAELSRRRCGTPVVVLTGYGSAAAATAAMKLGAADFIQKPIWLDELEACVREVRPRSSNTEWASPSEADLVRTRAALIPGCVTCDDAAVIVLRLLMDERVSLRYVHGLAGALRLLLTNTASSSKGPVLLGRAHRTAIQCLTAPWPSDPGLLKTLDGLETEPKKYRQAAFARLCGWSRSYLSRRMMKATGHGPSDWCQAAVLRAALRRLMRTTDQVSQVADRVGYTHLSQFDRDFRAVFGIQPSSLRIRFGWLRQVESTRR